MGIQMQNELFYELQKSIKEGGKILKGKKKPSREFSLEDPDPKIIREKLGLYQNNYLNQITKHN